MPTRAIQTFTGAHLTTEGETLRPFNESEVSDNVLDGRDKSITDRSSVRNSAVLPQTVEENDSSIDSYLAQGIRIKPQ